MFMSRLLLVFVVGCVWQLVLPDADLKRNKSRINQLRKPRLPKNNRPIMASRSDADEPRRTMPTAWPN